MTLTCCLQGASLRSCHGRMVRGWVQVENEITSTSGCFCLGIFVYPLCSAGMTFCFQHFTSCSNGSAPTSPSCPGASSNSLFSNRFWQTVGALHTIHTTLHAGMTSNYLITTSSSISWLLTGIDTLLGVRYIVTMHHKIHPNETFKAHDTPEEHERCVEKGFVLSCPWLTIWWNCFQGQQVWTRIGLPSTALYALHGGQRLYRSWTIVFVMGLSTVCFV